MRCLLGVDLGTTKICAIALDADSGALLAAEDAANETGLPAGADAAEQDAQAVCDSARRAITGLLRHEAVAGAEMLGLGVTGQMHGVVIADAGARPLTPLITWQDQRGRRMARDGMAYTDAVRARLGDDLARTGCEPATGYGAVTLFRMARQGMLPGNGVALTIHDLLVYQLTGVAVTDPTDAASWGIFDTRGGVEWLPDIAARLDLPPLLPPVCPTGAAAFPLRTDGAAVLGLPAGLPIALALGDNQASFLGSVPDYTADLLLNLGTGGQMSTAVDRFTTVEQLETRPLIPGYWLLVGASLCGGYAYHLLAQFFAQVGTAVFDTAVDLPAIYEAMNRLAENAAGEDQLTVSPLFCGTRRDPAIRALVSGIGAANFTPAHLTAALVRGMVGELVAYSHLAAEAGAAAATAVGSGNGVRRNAAVRREIIRQTGLPLLLAPYREEAAVGAALAAGVATGIYADWRAAGRVVFRA